MIETVIFFENGNFAAFDGGGQVPKEQGNVWMTVLQDKLDRNVIGPETKVTMPGWWTPGCDRKEWTVADLVASGRLKTHESTER